MMLLPAKAEVARHLERYRAWERLLLAAPADHAVRGNFENTGYTLCVLMGKRCAREAANAAEHYLSSDEHRPSADEHRLSSDLDAHTREQGGGFDSASPAAPLDLSVQI